jgi:hypothetical protein
MTPRISPRYVTALTALFLMLLTLFTLSNALAATGNLSYTRPATYVDSTPLPVGDIASYNVRCASFTPTGSATPGTCPAITPTTLPGTATGGALTFTLPAGGGRICVQVQTVTVAGASSDWSGEGCLVVAPLVPNAPTVVTISLVL